MLNFLEFSNKEKMVQSLEASLKEKNEMIKDMNQQASLVDSLERTLEQLQREKETEAHKAEIKV